MTKDQSVREIQKLKKDLFNMRFKKHISKLDIKSIKIFLSALS